MSPPRPWDAPPYRYTGRRFDLETGLYYYRARYYAPGLGRFMSPDPIGYGDGLNMYAYVGNDPLNFTDPSGRCPWCFVGAVIGGGAEYIRQRMAGEELNLGKIAVSAGAGALTGGVGAFASTVTSFAGRTAINVAAGAVANIGNTVGQNAIDDLGTSSGELLNAGLVGGGFGALGSVGGDAVQGAFSAASRAVSNFTRPAAPPGLLNLASHINETTLSATRGGLNKFLPNAGKNFGVIVGNGASNLLGNYDLVTSGVGLVKSSFTSGSSSPGK